MTPVLAPLVRRLRSAATTEHLSQGKGTTYLRTDVAVPLTVGGMPTVHDDELRALVRSAVRDLVPVLPVVGSPRRGYAVCDTHARGSWEEWQAAARCVCELYEAVR